jgi:hypothetical protein
MPSRPNKKGENMETTTLKLIKPVSRNTEKLVLCNGDPETGDDEEYFRCEFPYGTNALQKVDILTTAIKIIIQREPDFTA